MSNPAADRRQSQRVLVALLLAVLAMVVPTVLARAASAAPAVPNDAERSCLVGDIDNLGFGFPPGFDVFSGASTRPHPYPWPNSTNHDPSPQDPPGTDRIMVGSGVASNPDGSMVNALEGYSQDTKRPANEPQAIPLSCSASGIHITGIALELFVDDFQAQAFHSHFQATVDGQPFPGLDEILNALRQTGPIGKLITVAVPPGLQAGVLHGSLLIDDPTTGVGDGYAIDFARILINPHLGAHVGKVTGRVTDSGTGKPIAGASVTAAGTTSAATDGTGTFTLPAVPAGLAAITASAGGHIHRTSTVDLESGATARLDLALQPGTDPNPVATATLGGGGQAHHRSSIAGSLVAVTDVSTRARDLVRSAIVTALLVMLIAFPAELFNSTLAEHYDEVKRWFGPLNRAAEGAGRLVGAVPPVAAFVAFSVVGALIASYLDPHVALDTASITMFVGLLVGFVVLTLAFAETERRAMKRFHDDPGRLTVLPGSLVVTVVTVVISRLAGYQPGYLYGLIAAYAFQHELSRRQAGRVTARAGLIALLISVVAWVVWTPFGHMAGHTNPNAAVLVIDAVLAAIFISGIEGVVFGLVPIRFLEGERLFAWRRLAWAAVYVLGVFAYVHVLLHPGVAYENSDSGHALAVTIVLFVLFAGASIGLWAWFRFRTPTHPPTEEPAAVEP